jgi:hypothetical protein
MKFKHSQLVLILAMFAILISGVGCHTATSCITPPITSSESDHTNAVDLSVQLTKIEASGDIKLSFENTVKQNFDKLNDSNAALLLFLNAIDCYLQRGKIGHDVAIEMADVVRARWGAKNGLSGSSPTLSPIERQLIQKSPNSAIILGRLNEFGIQ